MEDGEQACGAECGSEDGDPEMLDAADEDEDGEGDFGDPDGDSDENDGDDGEDFGQEAGARAGNKGSLQNAAQNKGGKLRKNQGKKNSDEEPANTTTKEKKPAVPRAPWRQKKEEKAKEAADKAKGDGQAKAKKNNKILASMPANWAEEEQKFFDCGYDYDP